ncbi:MAG: hypothetical protein IPP69_14875 [Flavobacteriales bacterium]|nr:hypothetical protein [Flavobacteriales bacterium]
MNFENILAAKLGKYFSLTLSAQWIYDDNTIVTKQKDVGLERCNRESALCK